MKKEDGIKPDGREQGSVGGREEVERRTPVAVRPDVDALWGQ